MKKLLFCVLVLLLDTGCVFAGFPTAKVTYRVVDEQGYPIDKAWVDAGFIEASSRSVTGYTDTNGIFIAEDISSGVSGCGVKKDGCYGGGGGYAFKYKDRNKILNRLEPWNPTVTVVMKKIKNPVTMVYKRVSANIPVFDQPVGFDLEKGDFVAPHGSGVQTDFMFTAVKMTNVLDGATITLTFLNKQEGILPYPFGKEDKSWFKWPYEAPLTGYTNRFSKYEMTYETTMDYSKFYPGNSYKEKLKEIETDCLKDKEINYIFRVRSQVDKDGNLVRACYGKIEGEIRVWRTGGMEFRYWFNPDWTRNLEDDPKRNINLN